MDLPLEAIFQKGAVFHSKIFSDIDHGKFFVVIKLEEDLVAYFYINSEIPEFLKRRPELFELQLLLRQCNYPFLRYDSFLDAKELKFYSKEELLNSFKNKKTKFVDELKREDLELLLEKCNNSKLYTAREKEKYFSKA